MKLKLKHSIVIAAVTLSTNTLAADTQLIGTFKTIKDVTISQVVGQEMVINGLHMTSGACTVTTPDPSTTNWGGDTLMLASTAGTAAAGSTYGATAGAGCATGTSTPGVFEIEGASGATVKVTLAAATAGGLTFTPAGCGIDYDGGTDNDACDAMAVGITSLVLANTLDQTVSAGNGQPVAGKTRIAIAGSVTSAIGLTAATPYNVPFDIVVTY